MKVGDKVAFFENETDDTLRVRITEDAVFVGEQRYMAVPRCDTCRWWTPCYDDGHGSPYGNCSGGPAEETPKDHGCVQWEAKRATDAPHTHPESEADAVND